MQALLREELLKMELNNELDKLRQPIQPVTAPISAARLVSSDVRPKVVPIEITRVTETSVDDSSPQPLQPLTIVPVESQHEGDVKEHAV